MLDFDLAKIYGYETRYFNRQVNNNIERFDLDARFQLSKEEFQNLMCKNFTSRWGGTRKLPYAFTELGIYMLMTVLKGELAVSQSRKLIRLFKQMKDFIDPNIKKDYLFFNGQTVEADIAYSEIYSHAKKTIHIIDNYIGLKTLGGTYHDRYIFIDSGTKNEMIFHCGGSSKDGGKRVTSITKVEDVILYQNIIGDLQNNPVLTS